MYKIYVKGAKNCVAIMQLSSVKGLLTLPFVWFRNICPKVGLSTTVAHIAIVTTTVTILLIV